MRMLGHSDLHSGAACSSPYFHNAELRWCWIERYEFKLCCMQERFKIVLSSHSCAKYNQLKDIPQSNATRERPIGCYRINNEQTPLSTKHTLAVSQKCN